MLLSAYRASFAAVGATVGEYITTPEAHGWSAGKTALQNTAAFQAAIDDASANAWRSSTGRGVVELVPGKIYTVGVNNNGSINNQTACLTAKANVEIRTAGKPTRQSGGQARIQWESWMGKTGVHNRSILRIDNVNNFFLGWTTVHGHKNSINSVTDVVYTEGQDGGITNIVAYGGTNIRMKEVVSTHSLTDGLYVRALRGPITNWLVEDCTFSRNRRQGMSAIRGGVSGGGFDQIIFRRVIFSETGDVAGDVPGQKPGAGVDMEPSSSNDFFFGWTFESCDFRDNVGSKWHHGVENQGHEGRGFVMDNRTNSSHCKWIDCRSTNNHEGWHVGFRDTPTFDHFVFKDIVISGNATQGNRFSIGSAGAAGGRGTNWQIINVNTPLITWRSADDFPSPWNAGWSVTIWKGAFAPTVQANGVQTIEVHDGLPA